MAVSALQQLKQHIEQEVPDVHQVHGSLNGLAEALAGDDSGPRQEVIDAEGYGTVVQAWRYFCNTGVENVRVLTPEAELIREASLNALAQLSFEFPEIVDEFGFIMIGQAFYNLTSESTKIHGLNFMRNICVKNEANREQLAFEHHIAEPFVHLIKRDKLSSELMIAWCAAADSFTLSDDPSVAYNRAPERKRLLHQHQAQRYLCGFLLTYTDEPTLSAVIDALSLLARNEDFCVAIEVNGGHRGLQHILETHSSDIQLAKNAITCLRYLYTSPIVGEKGGITPIVKLVLQLALANREHVDFLEDALSCLSFITLRNPCACGQLLVERGVHSTIEIMQAYLEMPSVLKHGCLILKNVALNCGKTGHLTLLDANCESAMLEIGLQDPDLIQHHVNPVLLELGLQPLASVLVTGDTRIQSPGTMFNPAEFSHFEPTSE